jgi:hypothetical protein
MITPWPCCCNLSGSPSYKELQKKFSASKESIESACSIISGDMPTAQKLDDTQSRIEVAKVSTCGYETRTCWGKEVFHFICRLYATVYLVCIFAGFDTRHCLIFILAGFMDWWSKPFLKASIIRWHRRTIYSITSDLWWIGGERINTGCEFIAGSQLTVIRTPIKLMRE